MGRKSAAQKNKKKSMLKARESSGTQSAQNAKSPSRTVTIQVPIAAPAETKKRALSMGSQEASRASSAQSSPSKQSKRSRKRQRRREMKEKLKTGVCKGFWHEAAPNLCRGELFFLCKHMAVGDSIHVNEISCTLSRGDDPAQPFHLQDSQCDGHIGGSSNHYRFGNSDIPICASCYNRKQLLRFSEHRDERKGDVTLEDVFLNHKDNMPFSAADIEKMHIKTVRKKLLAATDLLREKLLLRGVHRSMSLSEEANGGAGLGDHERETPPEEFSSDVSDSSTSEASESGSPDVVIKSPIRRYNFPKRLLVPAEFLNRPTAAASASSSSASASPPEGGHTPCVILSAPTAVAVE
jgi:hypothetical protein